MQGSVSQTSSTCVKGRPCGPAAAGAPASAGRAAFGRSRRATPAATLGPPGPAAETDIPRHVVSIGCHDSGAEDPEPARAGTEPPANGYGSDTWAARMAARPSGRQARRMVPQPAEVTDVHPASGPVSAVTRALRRRFQEAPPAFL